MKAVAKIRVFCVDDHPVVRDGVAAIIDLQPDMTMAGNAATGGEALERFVGLPRTSPWWIYGCPT